MDSTSDLEKEFCPPIDLSLFHAIILDFDIASPDGLASARTTLEALRESAEVQNAIDPDAGSPRRGPPTVDGHASEDAHYDDLGSDTELTNITRSATSLALDAATSSSSEPPLQDRDRMNEVLQTSLIEIFPDHDTATIKRTLASCDFRFDRAVDELLNKLYIQKAQTSENGELVVPKSIDGFARPDCVPQQRRNRRRNRQKLADNSLSVSEASSTDEPRVVNKWSNATQEIDFIVQRTNLSTKTVSSIYHKSGGSYKSAMLALSTSEDLLSACPSVSVPSVEAAANELVLEFPSVPLDVVVGIVRLTYPSTATAHQLVKAFFASSFMSMQSDLGSAAVIPQYRRLSIDDETSDSAITATRGRRDKAASQRASDGEDATQRASSFTLAQEEAFAKAAAAYRKSRSHPLMGGAASYYASVGRDAKASADQYSAVAADTLAQRQSTPTQVDLHGIDVKNGVRISLEKVQRWWDTGSAEWARTGKVMGSGGFSVVTGVGNHSQGGKARLGPTVKKALIAEGWRVHDQGGVLFVDGRARK